jgi:hypothetical protein
VTSNHPLRRVLARVCSDTTMSRIVDPILADARWEHGRVTARGVAALATALVLHAIASIPSRLTSANGTLSTGIFLAAFILVGLAAPFAVAPFCVHFGPPLDFDAPRNGQVVAHIDVLAKQPPDIARIRITEVATGVTVWDVQPTTAQSECWNRCWNLTLRAGSNPAAFAAGHQHFNASVPHDPSFTLRRGTAYLFEVWDSKGRVARDGFTL